MPKMKSHSGLKKRVKLTKNGRAKRHKQGKSTSSFVANSDMSAVKRVLRK